jgi:hypothetical protein
MSMHPMGVDDCPRITLWNVTCTRVRSDRSMESRSGVAPEDEELDVPAKNWKIVISIESSCDVKAERWCSHAQ